MLLIEMNLVEVTSIEDHATPEGEAERDDEKLQIRLQFGNIKGDDINAEVLHKEELVYENIEVKTRSYK